MLKDKYEKIIYFDTETTGLDPVNNQIIEYGAFTRAGIGGARCSENYDKFVKLSIEPEIPQKITDITGITGFDLVKGIEETDLAKELLRAYSQCKTTLLVAYNAQFDLNFLAVLFCSMKDKVLRKSVLDAFMSCDFLDAMTVYADRSSPCRLQNAITHYGLDDRVKNSHRAVDDAEALAAVCDAMEAERDDLLKYINLFGYSPRHGISYRQLKKVTYKEQSQAFQMRPESECLYSKGGD